MFARLLFKCNTLYNIYSGRWRGQPTNIILSYWIKPNNANIIYTTWIYHACGFYYVRMKCFKIMSPDNWVLLSTLRRFNFKFFLYLYIFIYGTRIVHPNHPWNVCATRDIFCRYAILQYYVAPSNHQSWLVVNNYFNRISNTWSVSIN